MDTVADVIDAFGGPTAFAAVIGKQPSTASEMKRNGSIPGRYWQTVAEAAEARQIAGVTLESLARIHSSPPTSPSEIADAPAPEKAPS